MSEYKIRKIVTFAIKIPKPRSLPPVIEKFKEESFVGQN